MTASFFQQMLSFKSTTENKNHVFHWQPYWMQKSERSQFSAKFLIPGNFRFLEGKKKFN